MIPKIISEEEFRYNQLDIDEIQEFYHKFIDLLNDFAYTVKEPGVLEVNLPLIARISVRVDQRKDYYMYYHSTSDKIMRMSHEKELALWSYWVCKYKPIRFKDSRNDEHFFNDNGCTISDAFAAYIIISAVCGKKKKKAKYFTEDVVKNLYYELANRDFSKEAIISKVNDLLN